MTETKHHDLNDSELVVIPEHIALDEHFAPFIERFDEYPHIWKIRVNQLPFGLLQHQDRHLLAFEPEADSLKALREAEEILRTRSNALVGQGLIKRTVQSSRRLVDLVVAEMPPEQVDRFHSCSDFSDRSVLLRPVLTKEGIELQVEQINFGNDPKMLRRNLPYGKKLHARD
jgi:hypothetical protein